MSRYVDLIAVRAFPKFQDWQVDREDRVLKGFARHASLRLRAEAGYCDLQPLRMRLDSLR